MADGMGAATASRAGCAALAVPLGLYDFFIQRVWRSPDAAITLSPLRPVDWQRVLMKYVGLAVVLECIAAFYWLFPEYHHPSTRIGITYWRLPPLA